MAMCENDRTLFNMSDRTTVEFLEQLEHFNRAYTVVHRYFCALICICGVALNLVHIVVLTRRQMRVYAVNSILSIMATCDVVTMISYLIYLIRFKFVENEENVFGYNYYWLLFLLGHVVLSIALHTVSLYLSVVMAFIRVTALEKLDSKWVKSRSVGHIFFATSFLVAILSIPTLLVHKIERLDPAFFGPENSTLAGSSSPVALYTIGLDPLATEHSCALFKFNLWLTGICFKVFPCFLLFWFTAALMQKLHETSKKRRMLLGLCDEKRRRKKLAVDKTTYMLIIMLIIFLATELPQGALALLNALYTNDVHTFIYLNLGEVLDLLSLINCNTSFVLYCVMSSRYRLTFRRIFLSSVPTNPSTTAFSILRQLG
uniref:G_PROTEIN_RECEP_F1_2 domain-containing protein n=1 Tax=Steinernema glaseri TaxID=37863 RepID=A0A1I7Y7J3_9BILA